MQHWRRDDTAYGWIIFSFRLKRPGDWRWGLTVLIDGRWFLGEFRRVDNDVEPRRSDRWRRLDGHWRRHPMHLSRNGRLSET
jgi:hypothetical protein